MPGFRAIFTSVATFMVAALLHAETRPNIVVIFWVALHGFAKVDSVQSLVGRILDVLGIPPFKAGR